jgi:hypothetical protein
VLFSRTNHKHEFWDFAAGAPVKKLMPAATDGESAVRADTFGVVRVAQFQQDLRQPRVAIG